MLQPRIKHAASSIANRLASYGGWILLITGGVLGIASWKSKKPRRPTTTADRSTDVRKPLTRPPVVIGVDLKLMWFMCDGKIEALPAELERYMAAFENDLRSMRTAVAARARREIHHSAHRLVAHSAAVNYGPLLQLSTELQDEASTMKADRLDRLMREFDLQFAELKHTLSAIRPSTGCA